MKVYLAGKMDAQHGSWRDALLGNRYVKGSRENVPAWWLVRTTEVDGYQGERICCPWPQEANREVLSLHEYVGPYRSVLDKDLDTKYLGYFHGSTVAGSHGQSNGEEDSDILNECVRAIRRSDLMFAYINSPDCFGTLAEIGMAKAYGVYVVAAFEDGSEWDWDDYWFVSELVDATVRAPSAIDCGLRPKSDDFGGHTDEYWRAFDAWSRRRDDDRQRIKHMFQDAVLQWTARPESRLQNRPGLTVVTDQAIDDSRRALEEIERRFGGWVEDIARWTSDPRVRDEALRMTRSLKTGTGRR